ncbi:MAG: DUF11 domain-containing protein, partial [Methanobrevibacter sp.]|nr:DUF11 domain-containing protein [Candidatus Methanoflexus mossambicus]
KIINSNFNNNSATGNGGAIYNYGHNFSINGSNFNNNSADEDGGAIYNSGGSGFSINGSNFNNNSADEDGGAISIYSSSGFSVSGSNFNDNFATTNGGAISLYIGSGFSDSGSNFNDNFATANGGAIYNYFAGVFSVNGSDFNNNSAAYGGGIYTSGFNSNIMNSNFTNNSQAISLNTIVYMIDGNNIVDNGIGIQFSYDNSVYVIPIDELNKNQTLFENNSYSFGISGNNTNYTFDGLAFNGSRLGFIVFANSSGNILNNVSFNGLNSAAVVFDKISVNDTLINSNISACPVAIIVMANNSNITGNNIISNGLGVNITSTANGVVINFNRFVNDSLYQAGNLGRVANPYVIVDAGAGVGGDAGGDAGSGDAGGVGVSDINLNSNWWGQNNISGLIAGGSYVLEDYFVLLVYSNESDFVTSFNLTRKAYAGNYTFYFVLALNTSNSSDNIFNNTVDLLPNFLINITLSNGNSVEFNTRSQSYFVSDSMLLNSNDIWINAVGDNEDFRLSLTSFSANISIVKTVNVIGGIEGINGGAEVNYGDYVNYTINITNNDGDTANVTIRDIYDDRLVFIDVIDENGVSYTESIESIESIEGIKGIEGKGIKGIGGIGGIENGFVGTWNNDTKSWTLTNLAKGESRAITLIFLVNGTGYITNTGQITKTTVENNGTTNSSVTILSKGSENITAIKRALNTTAKLYDNVTYEIIITNNGNHTADFNVTDYFHPTDLIFVEDSAIVYSNSDGSAIVKFNKETLRWEISHLAAAQQVILHINFTTNATGIITNHISVNSPSNNKTTTDETNITVNGIENITVTKTVNVNMALIGDSLTYNIVVTNIGSHSGDFKVSDYFNPWDLVFNGWSGDITIGDITIGDIITGDVSSGNTTVTYMGNNSWIVMDLGVGESVGFNVSYIVNATGIVTNNVRVSSWKDIILNDTNVSILVFGFDNVSIVKTTNLTTANLYDNVIYTINVKNIGNHTSDFVVEDYFNGLDLVWDNNYILNTGNGSKLSYIGDGKWVISDLTVSESISWNMTMKLNRSGNIVNNVRINGSKQIDGNDSVTVRVNTPDTGKLKTKLNLKVSFSTIKYRYKYSYVDRYVNGYYVRQYKGYNVGNDVIGQMNFYLNIASWSKYGHYVKSIPGKNIIYYLTKNQKGVYISVLNVKPYKIGGIQHFTFVYKFNKYKKPVSGEKYTQVKINTQRMTATLKDINGKSLKGKTINFYADKKYIGSNITNSKGITIKSYSVLSNYDNLIAKFNGDTKYYGSTDNYYPVVIIKDYVYTYKDTKPIIGDKIYIREFTGKNLGKYPVSTSFILDLTKYKKLISKVKITSSSDVSGRYDYNTGLLHVKLINALPYNPFKAIQKLKLTVKLK